MKVIIGLTQHELTLALTGCAVGLVGCLIAYLVWRSRLLDRARTIIADAEASARETARHLEDAARKDADNIRESARKEALEFENKSRQLERGLALKEARIEAREAACQQELASLKERNLELDKERNKLSREFQSAHETRRQYEKALGDLSGLSLDEARGKILNEAKCHAENEALAIERRIVDAAKANAESQARRIIAVAIHRYSGEYTFDSTTSTLSLPNEEIKGRIIGREGRNIRAFEMATGITVLIDDTPNAVVLSGFDPVRREIAKVAMQRLIADGRIHPTRIEEVVEKSREEIEQVITAAGYEAQTKIQIPVFNQEITHILGKLKFRLSYSQNILDHSIEVAQICGILAAELGCDIRTAKQCGLLHDIGKAINHEKEGGHAIVGAEFLKSQGIGEEIVNGVASHHFEVEPVGPYGVIVSAADAISAARPGARSETLSTYLNRIESLEKLADAQPGIKKSYAVHAGREIRVLANAEEMDDEGARKLARNLARAIEDQIQYPGQIRVTVIRETRCVEIAK